jgi:hypothetical protein
VCSLRRATGPTTGRETISSRKASAVDVAHELPSLTFLLPVGSKLLQIGPEIADLLLVLY